MNREALAPWTSSRHVTHSYRALTLCEPAQAGASNDRRAAAGNEPRQRPTEAGATQLSHLHSSFCRGAEISRTEICQRNFSRRWSTMMDSSLVKARSRLYKGKILVS